MKIYTLQLQSDTASGDIHYCAESLDKVKVKHHSLDGSDYKIISSGATDYGLFIFVYVLFSKCMSSIAKKENFISLINEYPTMHEEIKERLELQLSKYSDEEEICLFSFRRSLGLQEGLYYLLDREAKDTQPGIVRNYILPLEI